MEKLKNLKSMAIRFNLDDGLSPDRKSIKRMLSAMEGMYLDNEKLKEMLKDGDIVVYEFYNMGLPEDSGELGFGTTILYPGKIGEEYYFTKGHFHSILETAEIYYCIKGNGYLLMESPEGDVELQELKPEVSVYVPKRYAHRSINISDKEPLISFFAYRADGGHD